MLEQEGWCVGYACSDVLGLMKLYEGKMSKFLNILAGAASVVALPFAAQALTLSYVDEAVASNTTLTYDLAAAPNKGTVSFSWTTANWSSRAGGYLDFTVAAGDRIFINTAGSSEVSYWILGQETGANAFDRLTTSKTTCQSNSPLAELTGTCNLSANFNDLTAGPLATILQGGETYRIGFISTKSNDAITFDITAVPVPASGVLLAGVLAGLAWRARRKAA